jgi:DeoR/GlpR family transcriptional regulator of sugar metabolism
MQYQEFMMLTSQRKKLILEKLGTEGQVQSKALSMFFDVSEDTIRRDLRELAAEGRLQRFTAARCRHLLLLLPLPNGNP